MLKWLDSYFHRRAAYVAETELNKLSDQQLKDLGITRSQIPEVVRKGLDL